MRLLDPGPGEILDRLTILGLKLIYGELEARTLDHWKEEQGALYARLMELYHKAGSTGPQGVIIFELAAVNAALWQAEDKMRDFRRRRSTDVAAMQSLVAATVDTAFRIQQLNDHRARLIFQINQDAGVNRPSDKV